MPDNVKRGRKPSHPAGTTDGKRSALSKAEHIKAGARPIYVLLTPEASESLNKGMATTGENIRDFVCRAVNEEAKRLGRKAK